MPKTKYLIDTNILIYHVAGLKECTDFINKVLTQNSFNISIITKIEFLGWKKHSTIGFDKCRLLIDSANVYMLDEDIANKAVELKRSTNIKLADAVIAATALVNNLTLVTRNTDDFKMIDKIKLTNPLEN
jgi:predicted nucleic acid-binding protein